MPANHDLLIIFLKAPRLGIVKTRLAATTGAENALAIYEQLVAATLRAAGEPQNVQLRYSPDDAGAEIAKWLQRGWSGHPQGAGDLGDRLTRAVADAFKSGAQRVAIIGSDCPHIQSNDIKTAWTSLEDHELVLGPAEDGGYWLIAMRRPIPELFKNISWSSEKVLQQTLSIAEKLRLKTQLLRPLRDVDTYEDWLATKGPSRAANARAAGEVGGPED